ncbi:Ribonuclease P/MRP protein subunit POP5 [Fulvia fulva]|uniref:Ribonuclease P/MRP protein subunit POP5 n=1 Tax=Passalora fulva TaxID=5499 RepID=A0A9Q8USF1_PASFU|nr:Ribonuclease P/MRP protein subunit POP5 [Fulvia fulva]KAK4618142.1 Ribonuclease P/MRP protein subunit POP5 [Fulvia fulva]KAK4619231.1 Ribonuclease P/MRP protein subunit POP5 [Fulvia fulva]UJO20710.1 Ribonuclease P/MRP protein subunit POP5 [Fulvia fulva]WPV17997.1 Ribonuclease P/MRP protein subunit POP5 [Fulvia fulva]WPV33042.1 Ribonuclease P/MRP protein subunit POP5 [Fulvia fulva]
MVRIKHRYLLLNILYPSLDKANTPATQNDSIPYTVQFRRPSSDYLDAKLLGRMIRDGVAELFGDYGAGTTAGSLQVKYVSSATSTAIVRVARAHYRMVWAALSFVTKLPKPIDTVCVVQVVRVSGTIKKAEEEAIRRARAVIVRAQRARSVTGALEMGGGLGASSLDEIDDDGLGFANGIEDADGPDDMDEDED